MAMSRSFGGTVFTTRPPIAISPPVMFSSPASMRSSVDLPQPEGPTSTTNSPSIDVDADAVQHLDRAERLPNIADINRRHSSSTWAGTLAASSNLPVPSGAL